MPDDLDTPAATTPTAPAYAERLWPGPLPWVLVLVLAASLVLAFAPVSTTWAAVAGVAAVVAGAALLLRTSPRVEVAGGELRAGGAHVPLSLVGDVRALDADATRAELGPRLDARAYVVLRGWIRTAVRLELDDPDDPTPYWLVSTRHPDRLAAALGAR